MRSIYPWHFTFYTWRFAFISSFFQYLAIVDKWAKCRDDKLWQMVTFQNQDQNSTTPLGKIFLNRMGLSPKTVFSPLVVEISPSENCNEENCFLQRFFCNGGSAKKEETFSMKKSSSSEIVCYSNAWCALFENTLHVILPLWRIGLKLFLIQFDLCKAKVFDKVPALLDFATN